MTEIDVYVPVGVTVIDRGSGIVGSPATEWLPEIVETSERDNNLVIDYEGNRFGAANIVTYADRCLHAAGRHHQHYPTVARTMVPVNSVTRVGIFVAGAGVALADETGLRALCAWLDLDPLQDRDQLDAELRITSRVHVA